MQGGPDYIVLKSLDTDGIRLIGSVLGQSIALDYFVSQVGMCQIRYYLDLDCAVSTLATVGLRSDNSDFQCRF